MPKYHMSVSLMADFEIDTDDYLEEFKENELDPNDEDTIHDFVRELIDDNGIADFDPNPLINEIQIVTKEIKK